MPNAMGDLMGPFLTATEREVRCSFTGAPPAFYKATACRTAHWAWHIAITVQ